MTNRPIKFRAWNPEAKVMYDEVSVPTMDGWTPLQFTGLTDKNGKGKEIYESDVVRWWEPSPWDEEVPVHLTGVVVFKDGAFQIEPQQNYSGGYLVDLPEVEVIGNIYENPELLNHD